MNISALCCAVPMNFDAEKCPEPEKKYFSEFEPLNSLGSIQPNNV